MLIIISTIRLCGGLQSLAYKGTGVRVPARTHLSKEIQCFVQSCYNKPQLLIYSNPGQLQGQAPSIKTALS